MTEEHTYSATITLKGSTLAAIEAGLREVTRLIANDFTSGTNSNDGSSFAFQLTENN